MDEPKKVKRGRPSTLDADGVLETAIEAYRKSDPADVSINAICTLAKVSKPSLYREFSNEDGLMAAVLDRYAEQVLSEIFGILATDVPVLQVFDALTRFASDDPRMETGCVFYKMRAGKHRLGLKTRARVRAIDTGAVEAFEAYLETRRAIGDWTNNVPIPTAARYLVEQIGLALTQRAAGENPAQVRDTLKLALAAIG
ncbi:MAG: TetR/AcrR family transcriptional regulator [Pseudomonadota bacterium]